MFVYLSSFSTDVYSLGPGRRLAFWVEGCFRDCSGCIAENISKRSESSRMPVSELLGMILKNASGRTGLTISGGEPFDQAKPLVDLLTKVKKTTELDIMVYTGYTYKELQSGDLSKKKMLSLIDILVDGPFRIDLPMTNRYSGSDNQKLYLLTPKGVRHSNYFKDSSAKDPCLQFSFSLKSGLEIIGIPKRGELDLLRKRMLERGIRLQR